MTTSTDFISFSPLFLQRDKLWKAAPYLCIAYGTFLQPQIRLTRGYDDILSRAKAGARVLDMASCLGQELRFLVNDGAPSDNLYGSDIVGPFWPIGYELFNDRDTFSATFIQSNIFDEASPLMKTLVGSCDIIFMCLFLHLFSYEKQVEAACNVVQLSKKAVGSTICGLSAGFDIAGNLTRRADESGGKDMEAFRFRHNKDSFVEMWQQVSTATQTRWTVDVVSTERGEGEQEPGAGDRQSVWLSFTMTRLE
jgi:hypothetical protein